MIVFENVIKTYQNKQVVNKVNLTIASGEFFVLVGPSGSGKTTILKMINRLAQQTSGKILIDNKDITQVNTTTLRKSIGYVLQNIALFPNLTISQNAGILLEAKGIKRSERQQMVQKLLDKVGLPYEQYGSRMPNELSGGEQQRVGIVRALITKPEIILMDEPFSALDPMSRKQLQDLILSLYQEFKPTIVFVTHDMQEALRLGTKIGVLVNGNLQQVAKPQVIINHPANQIVSSLFNNQRISLIDDLIQVGLAETITEPISLDVPHLTSTQNIHELATALYDHEYVAVDQYYTINQRQLLMYISKY